ncbi:oxidoreductase [Microlunatus aurantiacus]|uniref:Oxidoreductase n=1 Tax=Microlunatus aurantiacus TaxID=446786 RepID=A0ABP7DT83_9ACTN
MELFPLGPYEVSRVGFGAMQLPGPGVKGPPKDRDQALAVLRRAVQAGVNHIDTAQYYGPDVSNELIREALHPYADNLALVSKVGARRDEKGGWIPWDAPDELRQGIEDNLRSLQTERLAAVNLRIMDSPGPDQKFDDQLTAMIKAQADGLIAGIGLSTITVEHLEHALQRTDVLCVQNPYNLLERESQPVLDLCADYGIAFVPYFPLGSAFRAKNPVLNHPEVAAAAERLGRTPAQTVLAWTLTRGANVLLIPGTSSLAHLEENLAVADIELDPESKTALDGLA